jgi:hypothetical protein
MRFTNISRIGIITTIAGTDVSGYNGDNIQATSAKLNYPRGIFVTSDNTIYISDYDNHRIRTISPTGIITTIAGTGYGGYNGDNIQATSARLYYPWSIFVTSDNSVYISDNENHRIRKVSPNGIISTIVGTGSYGYNGDNIQATSAQLNYPWCVFVTSDNILFIADRNNYRVRKIVLPPITTGTYIIYIYIHILYYIIYITI